MSEENQTLEEKQKEVIQKFLDEQQAFDEQFRQSHNELMGQVKSAHQAAFNRLKNPQQTIPPNVQEIVTILLQTPVLVPLTRAFLNKKISDIQAAVQSVLDS